MRFLLALLLFFAWPGPAIAARNVVFGINDDNYRLRWPEMVSKTEATGSSQIAVWPRYDCTGAFQSLGQVPVGQPVLAVLTGPASCAPSTKAERSAYANAVLKLTRANPNIREVQVWNEPDLGLFWKWQATTRDYVLLLAKVHNRLAGTDIKVLGPGFSPHGIYDHAGTNFGISKFALEVASYYRTSQRKLPILDGFAYHPYLGYGPATSKRLARILDRAWRKLPQPSPKRGLRFWWTETGMESRDADPNRWPGSWQMMGNVSDQALRVAFIARQARTNALIVADFNLLLEDDGDPAGWRSGLYEADGSPKPALYAFQAVARAG